MTAIPYKPLKVGGQPKNQNAAKWTEEKALKIVDGLLTWMLPNMVNGINENEYNLLVKRYLIFYTDVTRHQIRRLRERYPEFNRRYCRAMQIQEIKVVDLGLKKKINWRIAKMILVNNHGYRDKPTEESIRRMNLMYCV